MRRPWIAARLRAKKKALDRGLDRWKRYAEGNRRYRTWASMETPDELLRIGQQLVLWLIQSVARANRISLRPMNRLRYA